jgi:hypothetical protein
MYCSTPEGDHHKSKEELTKEKEMAEAKAKEAAAANKVCVCMYCCVCVYVLLRMCVCIVVYVCMYCSSPEGDHHKSKEEISKEKEMEEGTYVCVYIYVCMYVCMYVYSLGVRFYEPSGDKG